MTTDRKNIIDDEILYVFDMEGENRAFSRKSVLACAGDEYFGDDYSYDEYGINKKRRCVERRICFLIFFTAFHLISTVVDNFNLRSFYHYDNK